MDGRLVSMRELPNPGDEALTEAAAWLARLRADDRSPADEELFRVWLVARKENATAFETIDHSFEVLAGVQRNPDGQRQHGFSPSRRKVLMSGVGLAVIAGGSLPFLRPSSAQVYETDVGEQRRFVLPEGSEIFLNAQTRLTVSFGEKQRLATLQYGRVNFHIAADAKRPFVVQAAERRIITRQCNFDVRCEDGKVQVVMIRGDAAIGSARSLRSEGSEAAKTLHAGDRLVADGVKDRLDRPNLKPLVAWQSGAAIFEDERLGDAISEMNRYSSEKLEIADASVKRLRVSGVYHVGDNAGFARSVSKFLPISVSRQGDHLVLSAINQ
jgi:transmembrane sensor